MTPSPSPPFSRTPPIEPPPVDRQHCRQPVIRAQENLIFAIKNIHENEFDRHLDQALMDGASLHSVNEDGLNPLEIAVIEQRPRIVQSLLARDAPLPLVPDDGFDLVMLAASCGHSAMLTVLIDIGAMVSDAQDILGLTALHYAVMGDHLQAAITLLDRGADINSLTSDALDREVCEKSHMHPALAGHGSTPLMFAVSKGNVALAELLLSRQADPTVGTRHPLEIAIFNDDAAMIDLLIQRGMHPTVVQSSDGQSLLSFGVEQHCSLSCIKKLLPPGTRIDDHSATAHSPLRIAIRTAQHEIAAYLLCHGAEPEAVHDIHQTAWRFADNLHDRGEMTRILVATRCANAVSSFIQSDEGLIGFYQLAHNPTELAIRGLFPELLTPLAKALQPLHAVLHHLTPAQKALEIAFVLMQMHAPDQSITSNALAPASAGIAVTPEQQLIRSIPEKINAQKTEIYQWAKRIVDETMMKIPDYYSGNFLLSMKASCPEGTSLSTFMLRKLREKEGFPDNLCEIIVSAWIAADENVNQWSLPGADANRINQCKEYYALHQIERVLFSRILAHQTNGTTPSFGSQLAYKASGQRILPVSQFARHPVMFLHALEHPIGQPALNGDQLTVAFCLETGLVPVTSRAIVDAWRNACQVAERRFPPGETEHRHHFSCMTMARELKLLLPPQQHAPDGALRPMQSRWETQLHRWCDVTLAGDSFETPDGATEAAPEESRPLKRARTQ